MSDAALKGDIHVVSPPAVTPAPKRRLPFSNRTAIAVGAALALAIGGTIWIALPKDAESTDAAYVEADSTVVAPKVRGLVAQVLVAHNQRVHAGDALVRIDPEEFDARVASANADLLNAQASVAAAKAALVSLDAEQRLAASNVRAAQTQIRAADAQSERAGADQRRYDALVATGAVARRDADQYRAAAITAASDADHSRAELDVSRNQAQVTDAKRATLQANLAQAVAAVARTQAALDLARQDQTHTVIRSPIDGVVGDTPSGGGRLRAGRHPADDGRAAGRALRHRQLQGDPDRADDRRPERRYQGRRAGRRRAEGPRRQLRAPAPARSSPCCRSSQGRGTSPRSSSGCRCGSASTPISRTWRACGRASRPR
ncbi:MAG: biotin/lipoyl-binding protein [Caulobacteraceae bacterium]